MHITNITPYSFTLSPSQDFGVLKVKSWAERPRDKAMFVPVVLQIGALLCHFAVEHVDDANSDGVCQGGHQPQVVGTIPCKQPSLESGA